MSESRRRTRIARSSRFLEASCELRVRFSEVDALGVVWHGHYLTYFEEGRNAFGRRHGLGYADMVAAGYVAPLVHAELDWVRPARFDDLIVVRTRLHLGEGARLDFSYRIDDERGRLLASGATVQLFTALDGTLVLTRPDFYSEFLARCSDAARDA